MKLIYLSLILLIVFIGNCAKSDQYPTDETLEKRFSSNKADFERLIEMFNEDSNLSKVHSEKGAFESFNEEVELPKNRLLEYKMILSNLNIEFVQRMEYTKQIHLRVWSEPSFFISGKSKFYIFSDVEIENTVTSLDEIYKNGRDSNDVKKIEGNWYLYLVVW